MTCLATDSRGKCEKAPYLKGMCRAHYERMKSRGTVELARPAEHLEPVTTQVNNLRGIGFAATKAAQTHCLRGHEFTTENTYLTKDNRRYCKTCRASYASRARSNAA